MLARVSFLLAVLLAGAAHAAAPRDGKLDFAVLRDGEPIGSHEMSFRRDGDALAVDVRTRVAVKVLFVTAYRFEHDGRELWRDGRLVRLDSVTDDDGTKHSLHVEANGRGLQVVGDGQTAEIDAAMLPASLWHEGVVRSGALLNTLDGRTMAVRVEDLGQETVTARGRAVPARHYRITGDLERELWYDADAVLVRVRFKGKDGSDILYELR